jgi:hypothetical protein
MESIVSINDIGTTLSIQVTEDEAPDDLIYEVIMNGDYTFYFNTDKDFFDWLKKVNAMAERVKLKLSNYPERWS